jgi:hypothetical protein
MPTAVPSAVPTFTPTTNPTAAPRTNPTAFPSTFVPTFAPSTNPTSGPTFDSTESSSWFHSNVNGSTFDSQKSQPFVQSANFGLGIGVGIGGLVLFAALFVGVYFRFTSGNRLTFRARSNGKVEPSPNEKSKSSDIKLNKHTNKVAPIENELGTDIENAHPVMG